VGSVRMISTRVGSLGEKCGAPTYGVAVAWRLAQDASMPASATNSKHVKTAAGLIAFTMVEVPPLGIRHDS